MLPIYGDDESDNADGDIEFYTLLQDDVEDEPAIQNALTRFVQRTRAMSKSSELSEFDDFDAQERATMLKGVDDSVQERIVALGDAKDRLLCTLLYKICAEVDPSLQHFWSCVTRIFEMNVLSRGSYTHLMRGPCTPVRVVSAPLPQAITPPLATRTQRRHNGSLYSTPVPFNDRDVKLLDVEYEKQDNDSDEDDALPVFAPRVRSAEGFRRVPAPNFSSPEPHLSPDGLSLIQHRPTPRSRSMRQFLSDVDSTQLFSRYGREFDELDRIGFGAFGEVYLARHKLDLSRFAVKKIIFRHKGSANPIRDTLMREVRHLVRLNHENVCRYVTSWIEPYKTITGGSPFHTLPSDRDESPSAIEEEVDVLLHPNGEHAIPRQTGLQLISSQDVKASFETPIRARRSPIRGFASESEYENFIHYSCLYVQTEYCGQYTLKDYIRDRCRKPNRDHFVAVFAQLVMGLAHIHGKNILHRDLKPENVFICDHSEDYTDDGIFSHRDGSANELDWTRVQLKIGDFGLSKECFAESVVQFQTLSPVDPVPTPNDHTGRIGTHTYASPEQLHGGDYTVTTDIYSLGVILFEVLLPPFDCDSERYQTINCLRKGSHGYSHRLEVDAEERIANAEREYPLEMKLIRWCTHPDPRYRPLAQQLLREPLIRPFVVNSVLSAHIPAVLAREMNASSPILSHNVSISSLPSSCSDEENDENSPHIEWPPSPTSHGLLPDERIGNRPFDRLRRAGSCLDLRKGQFARLIKHGQKRSVTPPPRLGADDVVYLGCVSSLMTDGCVRTCCVPDA